MMSSIIVTPATALAGVISTGKALMKILVTIGSLRAQQLQACRVRQCSECYVRDV